ncbi:hypothetical protein MMC15_003178 [Xylographa vitiligo]|nr:hypothetical protein [Xylographa vitiligo]
MPAPLLSIAERTEPPSPTSGPSPLTTTTINDQPPTHPPLIIPLTPTLPSPTTPSPKRPLPQQVLHLLCLPYRKRPLPTPPTPTPPQDHPSSSLHHPHHHHHRYRRTSFDTRYHSFPPPTFTGRGQPRALDSRLYPEVLADDDDADDDAPTPHEHGRDADRRFWSSRPHLWAEIAAAQRGDAASDAPLAAGEDASPAPNPEHAPPAADPAAGTPSIQPERASATSDRASGPTTPPRLSLRGGAEPRTGLPDAQRLPALTWRLAGGMGRPPTVGAYRAWRAREKARIAEANARRGWEGRRGRGFWREVCWVLGGRRDEKRGERWRGGRWGRGELRTRVVGMSLGVEAGRDVVE